MIEAGQTFRIQASPKVIERASRLFNATLKEILNELLQNSRRAGASRVDITTVHKDDKTWLSLADNGSGIFHQGVSIVLGESSWNEEIRHREDPAGMGIFSLANRGAIVESEGRRLELSREHFCGNKDVVIETTVTSPGTRILFPVLQQEVSQLAAIVKDCVLYYPVPVYWCCEKVERCEFLKAAAYREHWRGLEIGVFEWGKGNTINFYGLVVQQHLPNICLKSGRCLWVAIDVIDCAELKLVLPARKEVVQDAFFEELKSQAYRAIYNYISTLESHSLSYKHWVQAATLGISLQEAEKWLWLYKPATAHSLDGDEFGGEALTAQINPLLFDTECEPPEAQVLWRSFESAKLNWVLFEENIAYRGYQWYDALPVLTSISIGVEVDGETIPLEEAIEKLGECRPDTIWIEGSVSHASGATEIMRFRSDVALWSEERLWAGDLDYVEILIAKDSEMKVSELVDLLVDAYFEPSEDSDTDSYETQRQDFLESAHQKAAKVLLSSEEALVERIRLVVERHLHWLVPHGKKLELAIDSNIAISLIKSQRSVD